MLRTKFKKMTQTELELRETIEDQEDQILQLKKQISAFKYLNKQGAKKIQQMDNKSGGGDLNKSRMLEIRYKKKLKDLQEKLVQVEGKNLELQANLS